MKNRISLTILAVVVITSSSGCISDLLLDTQSISQESLDEADETRDKVEARNFESDQDIAVDDSFAEGEPVNPDVPEDIWTFMDAAKDDSVNCNSRTLVGASQVDIEQMSYFMSDALLRLRLRMYNFFDADSEIQIYFNVDYAEKTDNEGDRFSYIVDILNDAASLAVREVYTGASPDNGATSNYDQKMKEIEVVIPLKAGDKLPLKFSANSSDGTNCDSGIEMRFSAGDN